MKQLSAPARWRGAKEATMRQKNEMEILCTLWNKLFVLVCMQSECYTGCSVDHDLDMIEKVMWNFAERDNPFDCIGCSALRTDGSCGSEEDD